MQTLSSAKLWHASATPNKKGNATLPAMIVGAGLLVTSWLVPPWTAVIDSSSARYQAGAGFRSVFQSPETWSDNRTFRIDVPKLLLIDLGIVLATASTVVSWRYRE